MSDTSQDVQGTAQEPASPSPKPILVIGGQALKEGISTRYVDFCGCDFVSILQAQSFSDYKVVIYWPDETALELPKTFAGWDRLKRANPGWPSINPAYWGSAASKQPPPKKVVAPCKKGRVPPPLDEEERLRLQRHERTLCYPRLRKLLEGVTHGQLVVCVASPRPASEDQFRWIAPSLFINAESNRNVTQEFLNSPGEHAAYRLMSEISKFIGTWCCNFTLLLQLVELGATRPWAGTWQGLLGDLNDPVWELYQDAYRADGPVDFLDQPVTIQAGHVNGTNEIKSIVFTSNDGGLLLVPEPQTPAKLVEAVRNYMSSVSAAQCKICGWRHDAKCNFMGRGDQKFILNPTQAGFAEMLHMKLQRGIDMVPTAGNLGNYKTVLEMFESSPGGLATCKALFERRRGMVGLRKA